MNSPYPLLPNLPPERWRLPRNYVWITLVALSWDAVFVALWLMLR